MQNSVYDQNHAQSKIIQKNCDVTHI